MDIDHYANSAMSRAVLHLWRRENYAKCEISMSHGNIQANNVIRFKSLRIATPITLCARITETACNSMRATITESHSAQSGVVKEPKGAIALVVINQPIYFSAPVPYALIYPIAARQNTYDQLCHYTSHNAG